MSRKHIFTATLPVLVVAATLSGVVSPGSGQGSVLDEEDINVTYAELAKLIGDLEGSITSAVIVLGGIKKMSIEEQRDKTDALFSDLGSKLKGMLGGLGPNSVLMDNLEGAKVKVIVLKRWFERQPASYENRDQKIARLDGTIKEYGVLSDLIEERRTDTQDAWRQLARAKFLESMASKVRAAEDSVGFLGTLVKKLEALSVKIRQAGEQAGETEPQGPGPVSN